MVPTITSPIAQLIGPAVLAAALLCLSTAILRADEGRSAERSEASPKHCRMYFGCLPDLTKTRGRLN